MQWLSNRTKDGDSLFISNNPYIGYQDSVIRTYMSKNSYVETVGPAAQEDNLSLYLDTIAR